MCFKKDISKNEVFELSFLDELWQAENWGFDEETSQKRKEISIELNKSIFFRLYLIKSCFYNDKKDK